VGFIRKNPSGTGHLSTGAERHSPWRSCRPSRKQYANPCNRRLRRRRGKSAPEFAR
jgi:hypothetical protein